jgi:protein-S-isoprenylcysteine O-methyltransferase Ste14
MQYLQAWLIPALWLALGLYWWYAARGTKSSRRQEGVVSQLAHFLPLGLAVYAVVWNRLPGDVLSAGFLRPGWAPAAFWLGALLTFAGLSFAIWARVYIAGNWSGSVTLKEQHELVRSGPYRWVRHPIYSGLLLAVAGSALANGQWRGVAALAIAFLALWRKLRLEERWLGELFGDGYRRYRSEVAALIPGVL